MQDPNQHIAATLQQLRKQHGWSLDKTAAATGVSKAMLGQIERGESSPTVATLWKIATGFETSFSTLLGAAEPKTNLEITENIEQNPHWHTDDVSAHAVIPFDPEFRFELLQVTLPPHTEHRSTAHAHGVIEHVIPLNGALEMLINDQWQILNTGENMRFDASQPHGYRNTGDMPIHFHNLICYSATQR